MGLEVKETFANLKDYMAELEIASDETSDGGVKITKTELLNASIKFATKMGMDVVD